MIEDAIEGDRRLGSRFIEPLYEHALIAWNCVIDDRNVEERVKAVVAYEEKLHDLNLTFAKPLLERDCSLYLGNPGLPFLYGVSCQPYKR